MTRLGSQAEEFCRKRPDISALRRFGSLPETLPEVLVLLDAGSAGHANYYQMMTRILRGLWAAYAFPDFLFCLILLGSCQAPIDEAMNDTAANKAFITDMLRQKKQLRDYPGRASQDLVVHEPSSLPFGGTYRGLDAYEKFYPGVRQFYDFSRFELLQVYAEGDVVFALIKVGIADTDASLRLCEQFTFRQRQLVEVRLFLHDAPERPIHALVSRQQP